MGGDRRIQGREWSWLEAACTASVALACADTAKRST